MKFLACVALFLASCSAGIPKPCSTETLTAEAGAIVAECKLRRPVECKAYSVLDECPLIQECDSRLDRVGAGCHD